MSRQLRRIGSAATVCALGISLLALSAVTPARAQDDNVTEAGDVIQLLIPISGYVGAWLAGDKEGAIQLSKVGLSAGLSTHLFKAMAERRRPDATDTRSFPSGHTTAAYAGAEFIRLRYGNKWGIPAHIAAAFVGYSRIQANKHFADDVLAGAGNAMLWNWLFTTPVDAGIDIQPVALDDGFGIRVHHTIGEEILRRPTTNQRPRSVFRLEWGPVSQDKNIFVSPPDTGFVIDLATAEKEFDFTSRIHFERLFADRHEFHAYLAPMELIEFDPAEILSEPASFAGTTFTPTPGTTFSARYNFAELRLTYKFAAFESARWTLKIGGGAQFTRTALGISQYVGRPRDRILVADGFAEEDKVNAVLSAQAALALSNRWSLVLDVDGSSGNGRYLNSALFLEFEPSPEWRFGLGGRYLSRTYETPGIRNELRVGDMTFRVSRLFF